MLAKDEVRSLHSLAKLDTRKKAFTKLFFYTIIKKRR